jgi:hypothetical protein
MQYPVPPDTEGGSHLFVTLAGKSITWHLVHADHKDGISEIETLVIPVPRDFSADELDSLLAQGLRVWAEDIGWDLVDCENEVCLLSLCEGECVGGASLIAAAPFDTETMNSLVLETRSEKYDSQSYIDAAAHYFRRFALSHLVYVVFNWEGIKVLYVSNQGRANGNREGILVREMELEASFLDDISHSSLSSLLSVRMRKDVAIDTISNIRSRGINACVSQEVRDILRAYLTAALFGVKDPVLQSFGIDTPDGVLLITGDIPRAVPGAYTVLPVIDGLQLRGRYRIAVDRDLRSIPGSYAAKSKVFAFPMYSVFPTWYQYISTQKGGSGREGETAFRGLIRDVHTDTDDRGEDLLVGQTGSIVAKKVNAGGTVYLEPAKKVYFPNMAQEKYEGRRYFVAEYGDAVSSVIVDCRKIPVVYGPDAEANYKRVREWIHGLPKE